MSDDAEDRTEIGEKTTFVTREVSDDIVNFLSSRDTQNATLTVKEVMDFYNCDEGRARRVIRGLLDMGSVVEEGKDTYKITI